LLPGDDFLFSFLSMNTKQAKAEPLHEFLGRMGYQPAHSRGQDIWYRSPFRPNERTPSFKIDQKRNVWYDHALGVGGTIIDFVQRLNQTEDVSRVLASIADILGRPALPVLSRPMTEPLRTPPVIESLGVIADRNLEAYLSSRAIPVDLARMYLQEIVYRVDDDAYRALAFPNDAGGFEVRSPSFKGSIGKKAIRFLNKPDSHTAAVFEGVFDFLSVLAHHKKERANANVLVLNSVSLLEEGMTRMALAEVDRVYAYLDHDAAGKTGLEALAARWPEGLEDASTLYAGHKDANDFLAAQMP
jgi:Toprim-like/CHC2 zinc finger